MSDYLIQELERFGVAVRDRAEIAALLGDDGELAAVMLSDGKELPLSTLFLFLGASPCTEWLDGAVMRDDDGFVLTGAPAGASNRSRPAWRACTPRRCALRVDQAMRDGGRRGSLRREPDSHPRRGECGLS